MNGEVAVSVTIEGGAITAVEVTSPNETAGISDPAIEDLPGAIVEAQSAEVDTIAGCTMTSNAIIEGVKIALSKADGSYEGEEEAVAVPESADVVVVGLGFAGMNAALEAANNGADVLVLEKTGSRGGAMRLAGGTLSGACTKMQEEAGIEDSPSCSTRRSFPATPISAAKTTTCPTLRCTTASTPARPWTGWTAWAATWATVRWASPHCTSP